MNLLQRQRYLRHFSLTEIGESGQQQLLQARILCVGAGGLGCALLTYLTAAGVGTIGIIDPDQIELSNLQRQPLYTEADIGIAKVIVAKKFLNNLNPDPQIITYPIQLTADNAANIIDQYDIVADCTDNANARYIINDCCYQLKKPNVYAGILQFQGQCTIFSAMQGPCYRCLYPQPAQQEMSCLQAGVLGVLPGLLGCIQATEVIKLILKMGEPLIGRVLSVDALSMQFSEFTLKADPDCQLGQHAKDFIMNKPNNPEMIASITVDELKNMRDHQENFSLIDVREPSEYQTCNLGGKLIPLAELPLRLNELDPQQKIIVHCRSGGRSAQAVRILQAAGFKSVFNLAGGIIAWIEKYDTNQKCD